MYRKNVNTKIALFGLAIVLALAALSYAAYGASAAASASPGPVYSFSGSPSIAGCALLPQSLAQQIELYEPWYCPISQQIYNSWANDIPIALAVILLSLAIAGTIFMFGSALQNSRIRNFGIAELYEVSATMVIVVLFMYVSAVLFGLTPGAFVGTINPYATSLHLITSTISSGESLYTSLFNVYMVDSFYISVKETLSSSYFSATGLINVTNTLRTFPLVVYFIEPANKLASLIVDGITILYAEYYLIVFFAVASIPAFIIPGVIFRAIFPTRSLGGMLIAIGVAFYLVVPTLFAVAFYFTSPTVQQQFTYATQQLNRFGSGSSAINNALSPTSPLVTDVSSVESAMSTFWLMILFYPTLISALAYVFIQQFSAFIGGATKSMGKVRGFI
ncbi:MAG: hypothetical protein M1164_01670 [Candidatus Marsarchaeota archaeon]|nr:hypothetical protein [Candidatus Marsarchaeota archaeon]